jgi:multidrug efflux pump subunit AcrA (membrane-fusion protein)
VLQDKNFVWVVDSHGKAQSRDVRMGQQLGSEWVVEQGLAPGDVVVVDGTQKLKAGTPVKAQPLPETSASSAEPHAP